MNSKLAKIMLLVLLLAACTPTTAPTPTLAPTLTATSVPPTATPMPTATPTPLPPTETPVPTGITFVNDSGEMICAIFAYTRGQEGELPNLVKSPPLMPNATLVAEMDPDTYDLEVWDCQMNQLHAVYALEITEALTWNLSEPLEGTPPEEIWINVVNQRNYDMCEFYIRPAEAEEWGENILHPEINFVIAAGSSYLEWVSPGVYDLLIKDCAGNVASQLTNQEIPQNMTWTLTP